MLLLIETLHIRTKIVMAIKFSFQLTGPTISLILQWLDAGIVFDESKTFPVDSKLCCQIHHHESTSRGK